MFIRKFTIKNNEITPIIIKIGCIGELRSSAPNFVNFLLSPHFTSESDSAFCHRQLLLFRRSTLCRHSWGVHLSGVLEADHLKRLRPSVIRRLPKKGRKAFADVSSQKGKLQLLLKPSLLLKLLFNYLPGGVLGRIGTLRI